MITIVQLKEDMPAFKLEVTVMRTDTGEVLQAYNPDRYCAFHGMYAVLDTDTKFLKAVQHSFGFEDFIEPLQV